MIYEELVAKLAPFASLLSRSSYRLAIFGTDIGADPAAVRDLRTKLEADYNISTPLYEPIESLESLLLRMSEFEYVVTCRFHGVVFAHLLNKPVLAIAHHPKVTNLMNALGLSQYCVDLRTFDPHSLADTFECLVSNRDEVKGRMASSLKNYKSRLRAQFDELWRLAWPILFPRWELGERPQIKNDSRRSGQNLRSGNRISAASSWPYGAGTAAYTTTLASGEW